MKRLLIVESPAKTKTIAQFLGSQVKVMSTLGHIKDLPQRELGVTMNGEIALTYVVIENKEKAIAELCKAAQGVDEVYLAPDPDREGEIIAFHVASELQRVIKKSTPMYRITFNEITKSAVEDALAHPRAIDAHKVAAQQARRVLDRWVGYEVSPVLWRKLSKGLSAGRVQSVALRLICMREDEIRTFKAEEYWTIHLLLGLAEVQGKAKSFTAQLTHINKKKLELANQDAAQAAVAKAQAASFSVESIKDSKRARAPYPPFMTSTLQQVAYNQLGFSVQKTMQIAQKLYEGIAMGSDAPVALITYMRTDSLRLADSAIQAVRTYIKRTQGDEYLPAKANVYAKGGAQDAHEAIRPIDVSLNPEQVAAHASADEAALYALIWRRFVACQMKPAQYAQRVVIVQGGTCTAKVTGSTLLFDGFLRVYEERETDEADDTKVKIPSELTEGMALTLLETQPKQHFTQAPPRYTEASLVKELEKEGIGRPSTYQAIMKTIQQRAYTTLDQKKRFVPTELGMAVTKMLVEHLPRIMDIKFTAHMEQDLDRIEQGAVERDVVLREFYTPFMQELNQFKGEDVRKTIEPTGLQCPDCSADLVIRFGKTGPFVGCSKYPTCTFTSNFERTPEGAVVLVEAVKPQILSENCPQCGKPLREVVGRFGKFIACSGYPECKYIQQEKADFACPQCGGAVAKRSWKGKFFWGCTNYPTCTFTQPYQQKN